MKFRPPSEHLNYQCQNCENFVTMKSFVRNKVYFVKKVSTVCNICIEPQIPACVLSFSTVHMCMNYMALFLVNGLLDVSNLIHVKIHFHYTIFCGPLHCFYFHFSSIHLKTFFLSFTGLLKNKKRRRDIGTK